MSSAIPKSQIGCRMTSRSNCGRSDMFVGAAAATLCWKTDAIA